MDNDIEKLKEIFLTGIDEELQNENLQQIVEWEKGLRANTAFVAWQEHDITKGIVKEAKESYRQHAITLSQRRDLTEAQRNSLFAKQDACLFLISLAEKDARGAIQQIEKEIHRALQVA